jgi:hypothetical protein
MIEIILHSLLRFKIRLSLEAVFESARSLQYILIITRGEAFTGDFDFTKFDSFGKLRLTLPCHILTIKADIAA